jgi:hypothetical protein
MSRPKGVEKRPMKIHIDETLAARVDLLLFSPTLGRIPHGAYSSFFESLLRQCFESFTTNPEVADVRLPDLGPTGGTPPESP